MEPTFPKSEASADVVGCIECHLSKICKQVEDFVELTEQEAECWLEGYGTCQARAMLRDLVNISSRPSLIMS